MGISAVTQWLHTASIFVVWSSSSHLHPVHFSLFHVSLYRLPARCRLPAQCKHLKPGKPLTTNMSCPFSAGGGNSRFLCQRRCACSAAELFFSHDLLDISMKGQGK